MSLPDESLDGAVCFTMLHHVPSVAKQDRLLREVARVLGPGGLFAGTDSLYCRSFRLLHVFDTMVVVDPATFPARLVAKGFSRNAAGLQYTNCFRWSNGWLHKCRFASVQSRSGTQLSGALVFGKPSGLPASVERD
jgi:ubiquinone/menaquinone biosynthesis C-methylase UbiE